MTEAQAHEAGLDAIAASIELPGTIARPQLRGGSARDARRRRRRGARRLIGAWAVAPLAAE